jgi:hypothetical protein
VKNKMLVFIDDSGDPGFKVEKGSTRFFVISLVIFHDELEAEKTAVAIKELRRSLGFSDNKEFKFNKMNQELRKKFLHAITPFSFRVSSLVIDKNRVKSAELRNDKNSFYSYAIKTALKNSGDGIINARVKIDGSGDKVFRKSFLSYLRKHLNTKEKQVIQNCKLLDSKGNILIQMADIVAGAIRRSYDDTKTDAKTYKAILHKHIQDEWQF